MSMDIEVSPEGSLELLSQEEVNRLRNRGEGGLYGLLRLHDSPRQVHHALPHPHVDAPEGVDLIVNA